MNGEIPRNRAAAVKVLVTGSEYLLNRYQSGFVLWSMP
jgi:hypothetical protein